MVLIVDCYDSFVHNLERYLNVLGKETLCVRCDQLDKATIARINPSHVILSPGPCTPREAGYSIELVQQFGHQIPMLGVCLGHQVIAHAFGGQIVQAPPVHGKSDLIHHHGEKLFQNLPQPLKVGRYHSLVVEPSLPLRLIVDARNQQGVIMALSHADYPLYGVQFHPESILTDSGMNLLQNFFDLH